MIATMYYLIFAIFAWQETVPDKRSDEFEVKIDYQFKERPTSDGSKVYDVSSDKNINNLNARPLPYLRLQLKLLKLSGEEVKARVVNSDGKLMYNHKVIESTIIKIEVGFIDDVKDRVIPNEFTVLLISDSKKNTSQIRLVIMEDGTFMVNDEKKGKF